MKPGEAAGYSWMTPDGKTVGHSRAVSDGNTSGYGRAVSDGQKPPAVLIDAHAHVCSYEDPELVRQEISFRRRSRICTCFSTGTPVEWQYVTEVLTSLPDHFRERKDLPGTVSSDKTAVNFREDVPPAKSCDTAVPGVWVTFGIHPWYADQFHPQDWMELYRQSPLIGEIGMDQLWCDVPLSIQREIFEVQLQIAADLKKPVVLHTKDCEAQIAEMIRDFPEPVLVHWYSGTEKDLESYLQLNCRFTLGPDTSFSENHLLLSRVPADRLLTETDGIGAVLWAYEQHGRKVKTSAGSAGNICRDSREDCPDSRDGSPDQGEDHAGSRDNRFQLISDTLKETVRCHAAQFGLTREESRQQIRDVFAGLLPAAIKTGTQSDL
ncbi:MAG: TatD family hydrolase [Parasporobacterium sp.]|nr:TatD family hydrolase [Parasporobacterium sp.]